MKIFRIILATVILSATFGVGIFIVSAHPSHTDIGGNDLDGLNKQIADKKERVDEIEAKQEDLEGEIASAQEQGATLKSQITVLDAEIETTQLSIEKTGVEIGQTELEIDQTQGEIEIQESKITRQKKILGEFIRDLYRKDRTSTLEVLLANESLSEFLDEQHSSEVLENETKVTLDTIQELHEELKWEEQVLESKYETLSELKQRLDDEEALLNDERAGKDALLTETESQEEKYQALLAQAQEEQKNVEAEMQSIESEIQRIIAEQRENNPDFEFTPGDGTLSWPMQPIHGISAYFHDPAYLRYFGVPHSAIDIPGPQGTPLHAPASSYVVKYRNAGMGYSYVVLSHGDGLTTVYGHVSGSYVTAGDTLEQGEVFALSGGQPGTPGAGWMTTGPHLHFETRVNGTAVDPLGYLP